MNIKNALIEVGSSGAGLIAAQATENNLPGIAGPGATFIVGGAAWYYGPKWAKPAGAVMAGYGVLSAIKKLAFKNARTTGILAEIENALPGNSLPATVNGLSQSFDDFEVINDESFLEESLSGLADTDEVLMLEESLAGTENMVESDILEENLI